MSNRNPRGKGQISALVPLVLEHVGHLLHHGTQGLNPHSVSLGSTWVIPITSSYSYGSLREVEIGVVGSDLWRFASFSPSSSEGPFSVSRWSASLGTGKATVACDAGGLLCLLLLPAVGCSVFDSVMTSYGEGHSSSSSGKCLMRLSSKLLRFQIFLRRITRTVKIPFLHLRRDPIAAQVFFLFTSWTALAIRCHQRFQLSNLDNGRS